MLDFRRLQTLLWTICRYGVPAIVAETLKWPGRVPVGVSLRVCIERLGVTYVKLGQYLALRVDLLPAAVVRELDQLFDRAPELDFAQVRREVERELGGTLERFFREFSPTSLGAASVAQVHRAVAIDGEELAIKVQRPGVQEIFSADMRNLLRLSRLVDLLGLMSKISLVDLVQEFANFTRREMDFRLEAETTEDLGKELVGGVRAPRIRWDLTTQRLLAMEYIEGVSLLKVCETAAASHAEGDRLLHGIDLRAVMGSVTQAFLHEVFVAGRFHGDPHFGNILIRPDGTPFFIDWGIHGELSDTERDRLRDYIESWVVGDLERAAYCWIQMSAPTQATDLQKYRKDLIVVLTGWNAISRDPQATNEERHIARWQGKVVDVMRRNSVRLPPDQLLVWRAITVLEASALKLPYRYALVPSLASFFQRNRSSSLSRLVQQYSQPGTAFESAELIKTQLSRVSDSLLPAEKRDPLKCNWWRKRTARKSNRMANAFVLAFLLSSVALLWSTRGPNLLAAALPISLALLALVSLIGHR